MNILAVVLISLTLLHSERPNLHTIFAFQSAYNVGLSECNRVKTTNP